MKIPLSFLLFSIFIFSNCQNDPGKKQKIQPKSPEQIAQEWVEAFYSDNFEKAVSLGTDVTRMMIDSVKKEMQPNAAVIAFKISDMSCTLKKDSAHCTYIYQDEAGRLQEYIELIKQEGQWLVNDSWEGIPDIEQEFNSLREEVEKIIEAEELRDKE